MIVQPRVSRRAEELYRGDALPQGVQARRPKESPLCRLADDCYEAVKGTWEDRFEAKYGRWRGFVDDIDDEEQQLAS
jgi:hypothetical protein